MKCRGCAEKNNGRFRNFLDMSNQSGGETFIKHTLEQLTSAKEGKKIPALLQSSKQALVFLDRKEQDLQSMQSIFQPFQIACQSRQTVLATTAIDCLGKLFTYNYWGRYNISSDANEEEDCDFLGVGSGQGLSPSPSRLLARADAEDDKDSFDADKNDKSSQGIVGQVVDTICDVFSDTIDDKLQLQIVKALMSAISTTDAKSSLHGSVLLRAIRTTYNVFLFSKTPNTQMVAQATLQQMVSALFSRVPPIVAMKSIIRENSTIGNDASPGSLQSSIVLESPLASTIRSSLVNEHHDSGVGSANISMGQSQDSDLAGRKKRDPFSQTYRDLQLVFRALCKLSMKPITGPDALANDLKSTPMRSKLLSLHLINAVLSSHMHVFFVQAPNLFPNGTPKDGTLFVHSVKQYLCLSLSRNTVSVLPPVFDVSMEIFGKALVGLRSVLKKELSVVFTELIIPIAEARSTITFHQRISLLKSLTRFLSDQNNEGGKILVEIYLNYDCDVEATAQENIWERLINTLSNSIQENNNAPNAQPPLAFTIASGTSFSQGPPSLTTASLVSFTKEHMKELHSTTGDHIELKKRGLELLVRGVLKPLVSWISTKLDNEAKKAEFQNSTNDKEAESGLGLIKEGEKTLSSVDDPTQFQNLKHRKQVLLEGIKRFNSKPKKGMQYLLDSGCIPSGTPKDIAYFLLHTEGLNKTMIGEFLGEGEEENIAIMHAFVDEMDFSHMPFVTALRTFLQSFRLPGESQKIDRFMLKFAGRFVQGNATSFSSADTAYVLAYSVIMLNTDQHNSQVKKRMTKSDFLKNNRGIDEGKDIPPVILEAIFDEIQSNEIVMKEEQQAKASAQPNSPALNMGSKRETSESIALKTEAIFKNIMKDSKRSGTVTPQLDQPNKTSQFFTASHYEHVKPMFSIIWMAVLASLSCPLQDSEDIELVKLALDGFRYAAKIICMFDLEAERKSFLSTLAKSTHLSNLYDLKPKNVEAIKCLLDIALASGNNIGENWIDVVVAISQLEKVQQLTAEIATQRNTVDPKSRPNSPKKEARLLNEDAIAGALCQSMTLTVDKVFASSSNLNGAAIVEFVKAMCTASWDEITNTSASAEHPRMYCLQRLIEISYYNMNRIRMEWSNLWAILGEHFNQVGCHSNTQVCFFAIDKLRQLSMKFLELEELPNFKFQKDFLRPFEFILANNNDSKIKDMALACLQQMIQAKAKSMKSGWKAMFGAFISAAKEPNEQILTLSFDIVKTIFKNYFENIVSNLAFPDFVSCIVHFCQNKKYTKTSLQAIELLRQSFSRIPEISKTPGGSKILQTTATATEKIMTEMIAGTPAALLILNGMERASQGVPLSANPMSPSVQDMNSIASISSTMEDIYFKFWFPVFHALYLVIMTCELEVRTRALTHLFDALKTHGTSFSRESWEIVANGCLFPIFDDLKNSKPETGGNTVSKFASKEEMNTWVSTTMIQVLKQFIDLFGEYLNELMFCVDGVFDLLIVCMTQENETLARIGSTCLQQFIESNVQKLDGAMWERVCSIFTHLFKVTTPDALFFDYRAEMPQEPVGVVAPAETEDTDAEIGVSNSTNSSVPTAGIAKKPDLYSRGSTTQSGVPDITGRSKPQKKDFPGIITKCVLHLLVIQTLQDVLSSGSEQVYRLIPSKYLFDLIDCLERSYQFAKAFNEEMDLRMALYRMGFMKTLPNLLKQETSSVSTYITILIKMYSDPSEERKGTRDDIEKRLIPLSYSILVNYNGLDPESKKRNVAAWRPVVIAILNAMIDFDDAQFKKHIPSFYNEVLNLLLQEVSTDIRLVMHSLLVRAGNEFNITKGCPTSSQAIPALLGAVGKPAPAALHAENMKQSL